MAIHDQKVMAVTKCDEALFRPCGEQILEYKIATTGNCLMKSVMMNILIKSDSNGEFINKNERQR